MRIGLLASSYLSEFRLNTLFPILEDNNYSIKVAIIDNSPKISLKEKILKNIRRDRGGYIFIMALQSIFSKKDKGIKAVDFCKKYCIDFVETRDLYLPEIIDIIKKSNLDLLILLGGFGIIKKPLLGATPLGILSYHHGNMRKYRGMPPAFWELYNNEKEMGITVQILSPGIDCGIPIEEKAIEIGRSDTLKKLQNRALEQSETMLYHALKKLSNKEFKPQIIDNFGKVYTLPNLGQWIRLNVKLLWRKFNVMLCFPFR